jgi:hypothetical protein
MGLTDQPRQGNHLKKGGPAQRKRALWAASWRRVTEETPPQSFMKRCGRNHQAGRLALAERLDCDEGALIIASHLKWTAGRE